MNISDKMLLASQIATMCHRGQLYNGKPYIEHPKRVYYSIWDMGYEDEDIFCVAWLHDTVEDTDITLDEIREKFGDRVADAVDAISRRRYTKSMGFPYSKEPEEEYLERVAANEIASIVKHADMCDNLLMTRAVGVVPEKRVLYKKYTSAIRMLSAASDFDLWKADPDNQPHPLKLLEG